MEPRLRENYLKICGDNPFNPPILFHIDKHARKYEIVRYLISNNIVGAKLIELFNYNENSILYLLSDLVRRVDKDKKKKPLIYGRDYLV